MKRSWGDGTKNCGPEIKSRHLNSFNLAFYDGHGDKYPAGQFRNYDLHPG